MVMVTPHSYVLSSAGLLSGIGHGTVLDLYFVGGREDGYLAWSASWILDDQREDVPYNQRRLAGDVYYGTEVRADPDEVAGWRAAQRAAEAALRDAEAQVLDDHGLIAFRAGSSRGLRPAPGWRARARRWSPRRSRRRAAARYWERVRRVEQAYRPTREEIQARVREAERQAAERWERMRAVAGEPDTEVDHSGRIVHVSTHTSFGVGISPPSPHT